MDFSLRIGVDWKIDGIKYVDMETLDKMNNATQMENANEILKGLWNELKSTEIKYSEKKLDYKYKQIIFDGINKEFNKFPKILEGSPDIANVAFLVKSSVSQLPYGPTQPIDNVKMNYKQWNGKAKNSEGERPFIDAKGAWISLTYTKVLVDRLADGNYIRRENQEIYHDDEGYMQINFNLRNLGNEDSFNTRYEIVIQKNIDYINSLGGLKEIKTVKNSADQTIITFDLNRKIIKGSSASGIIYVYYHKYVESVGALTKDEIKALPKQMQVAQESSAIFDLTEVKGENEVIQRLRDPLVVPYAVNYHSQVYIDMILTGRRKNPTLELKPKVKLEDNETLDSIQLCVEKLDGTKYSHPFFCAKNWTIFHQFSNVKDSFTDTPNDKETDENKEHIFNYRFRIKNFRYKLHESTIIYNQSKIGLSIYEIILISFSALFILLSALFIFLGIKNCKKDDKGLENEVKGGQIDKLLDD